MSDTHTYLVMAHRDPEMADRLVGRLKELDGNVVVHLDKRIEMDSYLRDLDLASLSNLVPDRDRVRVYWGGYSMVRAILELIKTGLSAYPASSRFVLLSGQDYPVASADRIEEVFSKNFEYIQIDYRYDGVGRDFRSRFDRFHFGDNSVLNARGVRPLAAVSSRLERLVPRAIPHGVIPYGGPTWWVLSRNAVDGILDLVGRRPELLSWWRWTRNPDEAFVHTLLMMCENRYEIAWNFAEGPGLVAHGPDRHGLHHVDWRRGNPALPRTLDLDDADRLAASDALFARKVSSVGSARLLDLLDERAGRPRASRG